MFIQYTTLFKDGFKARFIRNDDWYYLLTFYVQIVQYKNGEKVHYKKNKLFYLF